MKTTIEPRPIRSGTVAHRGASARLTGIVIAASLAKFIVGAFALSLSPLLPDIGSDLHVRHDLLGFAGGTYGLASAVMALLGSTVQDKFSRRKLIHIGIGIHLFGVLLVGLAPSYPVLLAGKLICGFGAGILLPATVAFLSDRVPYERRAALLGKTNIGWAASTLCGVPLIAFIGGWLGWRTAQLFLAALWPIVLILLVLGVRMAPAVSTASVARSGVAASGRVNALWPMFLATFLFFNGFYGVYSFLGTALRTSLGVSPAAAGGMILCYGAGFFNATFFTKYVDRMGKEKSFLLSLCLLAVVLFLLPIAARHSLGSLAPLLFVWGNAQNFAFTSSTTLVSGAPQEIRGRALALNQSALSFGMAAGTATMGFVLERRGYFTVGFCCAFCTICAAALVRWRVMVFTFSGDQSVKSGFDIQDSASESGKTVTLPDAKTGV